MSRKIEQGTAKRKRLIEAACQLVAEGGFPAASVSRISERAGVPRSVVTYHFVSQENMRQAVLEELTRQFKANIPAPAPGKTIQQLIDELTAFVAEHPQLLRLAAALGLQAVGAEPETRPQLQELHRRALAYLVDRINDAQPGISHRAHNLAILATSASLGVVAVTYRDSGDELDRALTELAATLRAAVDGGAQRDG